MPAKTRRATPVDAAVETDLTDVPMTPMMQAMNRVGFTAADLRSATAILESLVLDASEGAWAEGQLMTHMLLTQGRRVSDRTAFGARLKNRGIDTGENWRKRTRSPIDEQPVPGYLKDPELAQVAQLASTLFEILGRIEEKRDGQYPALHQRSMKVIEARKLANAS
ncbi:hypothetical protein [Streptomyces mirabilis]|uniref:hypothetical protein n=1 Tax=Streptomyces mirabilis TaxID=68239 RepID=UPI0036BB7C86